MARVLMMFVLAATLAACATYESAAPVDAVSSGDIE